MEAKSWGWQLSNNRDRPELGYAWCVYVETAEKKHERSSTVNKPHKEARRNAMAALRRLRHKIAGTRPNRRMSMEASIWAAQLGIPQ